MGARMKIPLGLWKTTVGYHPLSRLTKKTVGSEVDRVNYLESESGQRNNESYLLQSDNSRTRISKSVNARSR